MKILLKISSFIRYKKIGIIVFCKKKTEEQISYYEMRKRRNSVDISFSQEGINLSSDLVNRSKKLPVILCIQGSGLVHRIIKGDFSTVGKNIPNLNADEYLIDIDEATNDEKLVVLYRKDQLDLVFNSDALRQIPVHSLSLGFKDVPAFLKLFSGETDYFEFGGNAINIKDGRIHDILRNDKGLPGNFNFAGKNRTGSEVLALTSGLSYFTKRKWNYFQNPAIIENIKEYTASKLSLILLRYAGTALFVILFANYLLFDHLNNKLGQLETDSYGIISLKKEITRLQSDVNLKKQFIEQNNIPENFAFAFYTDRLAECVPDGVNLNEMVICPLQDKVREDKPIKILSNTLRVTGTAANSNAFSLFLGKINELPWIGKINKQVYNYNSDSNKADFELEISLNNAIDKRGEISE